MRYSRPTERRVLRGLRVLRVQPAPRVFPVRKAPPAQPERKVLRALPAPRATPVRRGLIPVLPGAPGETLIAITPIPRKLVYRGHQETRLAPRYDARAGRADGVHHG